VPSSPLPSKKLRHGPMLIVEKDKYVPVFDPRYDTFESVRERSSMLFDVICVVGCRAECGE